MMESMQARNAAPCPAEKWRRDEGRIQKYDPPLSGPERKRLLKASEPTPDELAAGLKRLLERKDWKPTDLERLVSVGRRQIESVLGGKLCAPAIRRLLWLVVMLDERPEELLSQRTWETWGRLGEKLRAAEHEATKETRGIEAQAKEWLAQWSAEDPKRPTRADLRRRFRLSPAQAERIIRRTGFRPAPRRPRSTKLETRWEPLRNAGLFQDADWSRTDAELAAELGIGEAGVRRARAKVSKMPLVEIEARLRQGGLEQEKLLVFRRAKWKARLLGYSKAGRFPRRKAAEEISFCLPADE